MMGWRRRVTLVRDVSVVILASVGLVAIAVMFTPLPNILAPPLIVEGTPAPSDVIVILGGGILRDGSLSDGSLRRVWHGVRLFKRGYAPHVVFSTGATYPGRASEARVMAEVARVMGVPAGAITVEERSTRTAENAVEVAKILRARQADTVLLVTHPTHMGRAVAAFRRAGIVPRPAPTDGGEGLGASPAERVQLFFKVGHEYGGWLLYWWKGWV